MNDVVPDRSLADSSAASACPHYFPDKPIWTPEIERKVELVAEWVACDLEGSHIWGMQRVGKSEFAKYIREVLSNLLGGGLVVLLWSFLGIKPRRPEDVLRTCLSQSGSRAISARERSILQQRLIDLVVERCHAAGARRCVLVVDELQNIPVELYSILMSITSDLQRERLYPHLLSIGQPEMQQTIALMHQNLHLQTIGRFFPRTATYFGLSVEDIGALLKNMDGESLEFTTRWFPSRAVKDWSIVQLEEPLSQALAGMLSERNLTGVARIPFGYLRPSLNYLFRYLSEDDSLIVDAKLALECLRFSGLPAVIGNYVDAA